MKLYVSTLVLMGGAAELCMAEPITFKNNTDEKLSVRAIYSASDSRHDPVLYKTIAVIDPKDSATVERQSLPIGSASFIVSALGKENSIMLAMTNLNKSHYTFEIEKHNKGRGSQNKKITIEK